MRVKKIGKYDVVALKGDKKKNRLFVILRVDVFRDGMFFIDGQRLPANFLSLKNKKRPSKTKKER